MVDVVYNVDFLSTIFSHPAQEVFLLREERSTVKNVDKKREKRRGWLELSRRSLLRFRVYD